MHPKRLPRRTATWQMTASWLHHQHRLPPATHSVDHVPRAVARPVPEREQRVPVAGHLKVAHRPGATAVGAPLRWEPLDAQSDLRRVLLAAAVDYARRHGATLLEAYPVDKPQRADDDAMWFGAKSMYDRAGFAEVARRKPQRPVVRLKLV